jgi:ferredoxin
MRYLDVITLELDAARCNGCGLCVAVCPHAVTCRPSVGAAPST